MARTSLIINVKIVAIVLTKYETRNENGDVRRRKLISGDIISSPGSINNHARYLL